MNVSIIQPNIPMYLGNNEEVFHEKEIIEKGYAAFAPDGRMLRNEWVGGGQTGTNRQTLTTDIEKVSLAHSLEEVKIFINWYNSNHKIK